MENPPAFFVTAVRRGKEGRKWQLDYGVQFSHTLDEEIGGQLRAGFMLTDIYEDTNGGGFLHEHGVPCFVATRCVKK